MRGQALVLCASYLYKEHGVAFSQYDQTDVCKMDAEQSCRLGKYGYPAMHVLEECKINVSQLQKSLQTECR